MNDKVISDFQKMLDVNIPIIYIHNHDFVRVDEMIFQAVGKDVRIEEWNSAVATVNFKTKEPIMRQSLEDFLRSTYIPEASYTKERLVVLKEIQYEIENPTVKTLLMMIAQRRLYDKGIETRGIGPYSTTVVIVSSVDYVPEELIPYVSYLEPSFPDEAEINQLISAHRAVNHDEGEGFDERDRKALLQSLKGLTAFEIDRTLDMAMSENGTLRAEDTKMILAQKKQMVKKSGLLEFIDTPERNHDKPEQSIHDNIGGLNHLKEYLEQKAEVMKEIVRAQEYAVRVPKGIFIVGMPGCGKSLCAKATASLFGAPLLKMDMGSMMGKYVGESEGRLRSAIKLAEAAAPCILWIDEIEKAFTGVGSESSEVITRMFGYFLSWLQEKTSNVYVVATANNAENLPPELKRKGRFDEIFCVNLPTDKEREAIFKVHLNKKKNKAKAEVIIPNEKELTELNRCTKGFNGADIESVVDETLETLFVELLKKNGDSIKITIDQLKKQAEKTISISASCKKQIEKMEKIFGESSFIDATTGEQTLKKK